MSTCFVDGTKRNDYHSRIVIEQSAMKPRSRLLIFVVSATLVFTGAAAADAHLYTLAIKDHHYQPDVLSIPAGSKVKIRVHNEDATPEEFESTDFNRELIVLPHGSVTVYVGPLRAGTYRFFGDFHPSTAQGRLIVR